MQMTIRYNQDLVKHRPLAEHFTAHFWQQVGQQSGTAGGRNLAYFIQTNNELSTLPMVLRHYYRGGLVGKVNRDWFLRQSFARQSSNGSGVPEYLTAPVTSSALRSTRSFAEFELLAWMYEQGLPVPRPIAASITPRCGLWYQADILIERLPCDGDVFALLKREALSHELWHELGRTIASMHQHGVYHSDLNCHNLLVARGEPATHQGAAMQTTAAQRRAGHAARVWLIDFDKCERREAGEWTQANLARLRRSFDKEKSLHENFHFSDENWQWLMDGYRA